MVDVPSSPKGEFTLNIERLRELRAAGQWREAYNGYLQLLALWDTCAETCLIGGQAAKKLGDLWAAKDCFESCLEREPEGDILGMARFLLGEVMRLLGRTHEAILHLTAFIDGLPEYPQLRPIALGAALFNRGMAFRQATRLEESWDDYAAACDEFRREEMPVYLFMALQNLAWVGALFGDAIQAREALQEARPLCTTPAQQWHHRLGEAFLAALDSDPLNPDSQRASLRRGLELCQVIYQHEGEDLPAEVRTEAYWLAGKISLDLNDIDAALHFGHQALQLAVSTPVADKCSLYDAADLLRQAHAHRLKVQQSGV